MKNSIIILLILFSKLIFATEYCPYADGSVEVQVSTEVKQHDDNYEYEYTIINVSKSEMPLHWFFLESKDIPVKIELPVGWTQLDLKNPMHKGFLKFGAIKASNGLRVNEKLSGIKIISKNPPGAIIAKIRGINGSKNTFTKFPVPANKICPGFWDLGSSSEGDPTARIVVTGPSSKQFDRVEVISKINNHKWSKTNQISPIEKGTLEILVPVDFKMNDIVSSSISFGRGLAKPLSIEELTTIPFEVRSFFDKETRNILKMKFNISDINILCDLDRFLLLEGKLKNNSTFQALARLKMEPCTPENWVKEIPNIKMRMGL